MDQQNEELKTLPVKINNPRILITGGFGYVGSELIRQLPDYQITVIDNLISGEALSFPNVRLIQADILNLGLLLKSIFAQHDIIIHLAAIVGEPACSIHAKKSAEINILGTAEVLSALQPHHKFIFTSTSSVYGNVSPIEMITEEFMPNPQNNYAMHKFLTELMINQIPNDYIILRPVTAFGLTSRVRLDLLVNTFIYDALNKGVIELYEPNLVRPMISVLDFARVITYAIEGKLPYKQVYNIGDSRLTMTKLELAKTIASLTNAEVIARDGKSLDLRNYNISFDKIQSTGFVFSNNRLEAAINQIKDRLKQLQGNEQQYTTPELFRNYLKEGR